MWVMKAAMNGGCPLALASMNVGTKFRPNM